ncbi:MAG: GNAT family N-acetyltransferase [Chlorobi bacterium]|nr:GNAT family N-acetyltransferase [Chlorobiota bacterium]
MKYFKENYVIDTDKNRLDRKLIHSFLLTTYWAKTITFEQVNKAIENSLCFGMYSDDKQIGFARVLSDFSGFAYIADVFILPERRGKGLSKWLMEVILEYPDLQNLRRWLLATKDAHSLYEKFGFTQLENPKQFMELHDSEKNPY